MRELLVGLSVAAVVLAGVFLLPYPKNPFASPDHPRPQSAATMVPAAQSARQETARAPAPSATTSAQPAAAATSPATPAGEASQSARIAQAPAPHAATPPAPAVAPATPTAASQVSGDLAHGRDVYRKCQACHSLEPGKNLLGPSLAGTFGKKAGSEATYNYSPALKNSGLTWDAATLDRYLLDPQKTVPGNKMPFPGLKTVNDRKDVIAYLAAATPAAAAAPAPGALAQAPSTAPPAAAPAPPPPRASIDYIPDMRYTLRSGIAEGRMVYIGVG